jgi:hypothetical protein
VIREADYSDIPHLVEMGRRFVELAYSRINVPFDYISTEQLLSGLVDNPDGVVLTNDDCTAMFGAIVHSWHFNANIKTATELFWWAEDGCRDGLAMRRKGEEMVKALGAKTMNMANQEHMRSKALARLYRMEGYVPSENIFIKEFA